jgi:hypothetical protein
MAPAGGVVRSVDQMGSVSGMKVLVSLSVQPLSARWLSAGAHWDSAVVQPRSPG